MEFINYIMIGSLAGLLAGLLGIGGGLVVVPALLFIFVQNGLPDEIVMHLAIGTSLATITFTSMSSIRAHHFHKAIAWPIFYRMLPGIVIGGILGAFLADVSNTFFLKVLFGIFIIIVAAEMQFSFYPDPHRQLPSALWQGIAGVCIACFSALVGVSGGALTVPYLTWHQVPINKAIGTAAACGFPIAVAGAIGFALSGLNETALPPSSFGFIYLPAFMGIVLASVLCAPIGAYLSHKMPGSLLRRIFALFLLLVGIRMITT